MRYFILALTLLLPSCATIETTITGPGYKYKERITAIGGGSIEKASQSLGGKLKVYNEDGSPLVDVELQSNQDAEGMTSDMEAILAIVKLVGSLASPSP